MKYDYWLYLRDADGLTCYVTSNYISKTRLHHAIDFYSKFYIIEQLLVRSSIERK